VLLLRAFGARPAVAEAAERLRGLPGAHHVVRTEDGTGPAMVTADIAADAADLALAAVRGAGIAADDVDVLRVESIGTAARPDGLVWADLLTQAGLNARLFARYLVLMAMAGIVAAFGVIERNGILIVGAMAISPDTLPITAACTGIVLKRWRLAGRALGTLATGLAVAGVVAGAMTAILDVVDLLPQGFEIDEGGLRGLQTVNISTPIVAFAAGVVGVLALETRASAAVGVAISVTTIPASAYLGVAAAVGEMSKAAGALLVLGINVAMLLAGGCTALLVQRRLQPRRT
jgi:uncharacterized hydrophobic protein (TIGR00271 family)